jgi:arylsulfatase
LIFSGDETTDLGEDTGTPVTDDFGPVGERFNGRIQWVELDIDEAAEDLDHLITPEERLRIAMARQ